MTRNTLVVAITLVLILICAVLILNTDIEPRWDQSFILYELTLDNYPAFSDGIVSRLIVGLYNRLWSLDPATLNAHIRALAMSLYMVAGLMVLTVRGASPGLSMLFILLLFTSRFPFLWLSSELFAGSFLMLTLWAVARRLPFVLVAFFLACFSFSKPDLIFSGALVGGYLVLQQNPTYPDRWRRVAILTVIFATLSVPAIWQHGLHSNRSLVSFSQHYAALVASHQIIQPPPSPWTETEQFMEPIWGQHDSLLSMIRSNPQNYFDFLFLSVARTIRSLVRSRVILMIPLWLLALVKSENRPAKVISVLFLSGFIPITLFSYTHVRYLARFYPVFLFLPYLHWTENRPHKKMVVIVLIGLLILQSILFVSVMSEGEWFPD